MPQPGFVVSLRINPNDVMAIIDTLDYLGIPKDNLSFAQASKLVFSSALQSFRDQGLIPKHDGFEYLKMVEPFEMDKYASRSTKLKLAKQLSRPPEERPMEKVRKARLEELMFKHANNRENMEEGEMAELAELLNEAQT